MADLSLKADSQRSALRQALLQKRLRGKGLKKTPEFSGIPRRTESGPAQLSFAQQRLWFIEQLDPGHAAYNVPFGFRLRGELDPRSLERSLQEIMKRHEALRTTFRSVEGRPVATALPGSRFTLPLDELQHLPDEERESVVQKLILEESHALFDLQRGPLFRARLLCLKAEEHILLITVHHIAFDGWSVGVFMRELTTIYEAFFSGSPSPLKPLKIQYADFAEWQRDRMQGDVLEHQLEYWQARLAAPLPVLELPTDRPRPAKPTYQGETHAFTLPETLAGPLKTLADRTKCTPFMLLLAAFNVLLYRYSGQEDLLVGTPLANRTRSELNDSIGFFVNTLALRSDLSGAPTFYELLKRVRTVTLEAHAYQELPFDLLVTKLHPERKSTRQALFQVMFALQNAPTQTLKLRGVSLEALDIPYGEGMFDLVLEMFESSQGFKGYLRYDTDLFDAATITRMEGHFRTLLEGMIGNPQQRIAELPLLTEAERQQILYEWNDTGTAYPQHRCIHELFEEQAARSPEAIALVFEEQQLSYRELNQKANQLARYLKELGVGPEVLVGVCVERSLEMIVGLLGILKAGGAYLPLDPNYPTERLAFMLEDSQVSVLLIQRALLRALPEYQGNIVCLDTDWHRISQEEKQNISANVTAENLAYVIYTSGSTGKPKGVQVLHQGGCNLSSAQINLFDVQPSSRILQFASFSFDASVWEIIMALCSGASLHLGSSDALLPGPALARFLQKHAITHITLSPSALANLPFQNYPNLQVIVVAGEACHPDLAAQWSKSSRFFNAYGPTETTVCATILEYSEFSKKLSIGTPLANMKVHILDQYCQPVPVGIPGELHVGSKLSLARGYLNRPKLTRERFIPDPFNDDPEARLYKTGDLARYLPDGNIEFLGRIDHQVKIRGFRIELGEIEAVLRQHPAVREAVVVTRELSGDKQLAAYLVLQPGQEAENDELRQHLKTQLPEYMVPATFSILEALPLTPNGKIDCRALPDPAQAKLDPIETTDVPRSHDEILMADIWKDLLGLPQVGIHDRFFEIGGHSLLSVRLMSRIEDIFQISIPLQVLFDDPSIDGLTGVIAAARRQGTDVALTAGPQIDFHSETLLDAEIRPDTSPRAVLLTGGTGFLGAFLLYELLQQSLSQVYCLVRAGSRNDGLERLRNNLSFFSLWDDDYSARIHPVPGDLGQASFGLRAEEFTRLAERIDVIYHNGALVNFVYPYSVLKGVNVLGTKEVLRFAGQRRIKPVHYVSTLAVFLSQELQHKECIAEEQSLDEVNVETLDVGYSQTKWVAEKLIEAARLRGIPVTIYRPGGIMGHSRNGKCHTDDFVYSFLKGCIQMRQAPEQQAFFDLTPVDYAAQAIVALSLMETSCNRTFHITNPESLAWNDFVKWIQRYGYELETVPYLEWRQELARRIAIAGNALEPFLPMFSESDIPPHERGPQRFSCRNTIEALTYAAIACPPPDPSLLNTYFSYLLRSRFLEPPLDDLPMTA